MSKKDHLLQALDLVERIESNLSEAMHDIRDLKNMDVVAFPPSIEDYLRSKPWCNADEAFMHLDRAKTLIEYVGNSLSRRVVFAKKEINDE